VLQWKKDQDITRYEPEKSVHGASMLRQDKNPDGYQANLESLINFLKRFN
jgi:hypothetical protein